MSRRETRQQKVKIDFSVSVSGPQLCDAVLCVLCWLVLTSGELRQSIRQKTQTGLDEPFRVFCFLSPSRHVQKSSQCT